ncbi:MAG: NAD(P)H-nitrite reductase large subunit [Halobacteriales archaeon]|jgi:NAD(P)H-nitrite reductase large subunit
MADSYVILGDGVAGSSAAGTIREEAPEAEITVVTDEGEPFYNRILTKEFAKGKLPEAPVSIHEEGWYEDRDIDLRLNTFVTDVDTDAQEVQTHEGDALSYDKLLVATGGTPLQLPVANADADGIHHFWTFQDARGIAEDADESDSAVIIGAGLLGIDFVGVCGVRGIDAKLIMRGKGWWRYACTETGSKIIHEGMREMGVEPITESGVERFEMDDDGHVTGAVDVDGNFHDADWVGVGIGLNFNTEFLQGSPVETDGGVIVDEHMRTNVENVYAAGDITRYYDVILEDRNQNGSWGSAKEQGNTAALNMVNGHGADTFEYVPSYSITHFDFPFLSLGHPTRGSEGPVTKGDPHGYERKYDDYEWRRVAFEDGRLVGAALIGDLSPQTKLKQLIRGGRRIEDQAEKLLERDIDLDNIE